MIEYEVTCSCGNRWRLLADDEPEQATCTACGADTLVALGKHVPALSAARLTILWYLVPALGAVSWIVYGLLGARSRGARVVALAALVVSVLAAGAFRQLAGTARLGWGPKVALVGGFALCAGAWVPDAWLRARRPVARSSASPRACRSRTGRDVPAARR